MRNIISGFLLLASGLLPFSVQAEEVTLQHQGLKLNANLSLADSGYERIFLITHGTLAHNKMEIIAQWQSLLADEDISSLAINLSLGLDDRHGMYDCPTPHTHKHTDAIDEISTWVNWLKAQGSQEIILAAHSRGGNQTAWFAQQQQLQQPMPELKAQILLAPQTWSESNSHAEYQERYKTPLTPLLDKAKASSAEHVFDKTDFIYCEDTQVTASSFLSYYASDMRMDTPTLLQKTTLPSLVFIGTEDTTVADLAEKMTSVENANVEAISIEGADHFFRDLYMDEVIENTLEFLDRLQ